MRLMLLCAIAARLPIAMDSTDRTTSMSCHPLGNCGVSPESGCRAFTSNRMAIANAASLGPVLMKSVTAEGARSEEHTSELQSQSNLVCRLLLEKKKKKTE